MERPKQNIIEEAVRIVDTASRKGITVRLLGGLATRVHCEDLRFCERFYSDIDLVGLSSEKMKIIEVFLDLGYTPNTQFNALHGHKRLEFEDTANKRHADVFLDHFDMDHDWDLTTRLQVEKYTLPLSDLLLMKLQICKLSEKDVRDILTILKDCDIGAKDAPHTINAEYVVDKCADDWELYESVLENVEKILQLLPAYDLEATEKNTVEERLITLARQIVNHPKTAEWKLRSLIGKRMGWCNSVEE